MKRRRKSIAIRIAIALVLAFLILNTYFILKEFGVIKSVKTIKEKEFTLLDQCSIIAGKLVHTINSEGECINKCVAECETYDINYEKAEFEISQEACHFCKCYCNENGNRGN